MTTVTRVFGLSVLLALAPCGVGMIAAQGPAHAATPPVVGISAIPMPGHTGTSPGVAGIRLEPLARAVDGGYGEYAKARRDHLTVALAVSRCYPDHTNPLAWSAATRTTLFVDAEDALLRAGASGDDPRISPPALNPVHAAALAFSDRLARDRIAFGKDLEDNRYRAKSYEVAAIILGALATVTIGIRSMLGQSAPAFLSLSFGILALMLSATGTGVSSMKAFDDSQSVALRTQRTLSQLQQLHWRIASDILGEARLCPAGSRDAIPAGGLAMTADEFYTKVSGQVDAWKVRLEMILDSAVDTVARPGDLPLPSDRSAPKPVTKEAAPAAGEKIAMSPEAAAAIR